MGLIACYPYDSRLRDGTICFTLIPMLWTSLYDAIRTGNLRTIVTDVTMAASGIRKGALQRLGVEVKCYLNE